MMAREKLPNRRSTENFEFIHPASSGAEIIYSASVGYYGDGRVGEVFLSSGRTGTDVDLATRDSAIAFSLALQFGCPMDVIAPAFLRREDGKPEGPLGTLVNIIMHMQEAKNNALRRNPKQPVDTGNIGTGEIAMGEGRSGGEDREGSGRRLEQEHGDRQGSPGEGEGREGSDIGADVSHQAKAVTEPPGGEANG